MNNLKACKVGVVVTISLYGYKGRYEITSKPYSNRAWGDWEVSLSSLDGAGAHNAPVYALLEYSAHQA